MESMTRTRTKRTHMRTRAGSVPESSCWQEWVEGAVESKNCRGLSFGVRYPSSDAVPLYRYLLTDPSACRGAEDWGCKLRLSTRTSALLHCWFRLACVIHWVRVVSCRSRGCWEILPRSLSRRLRFDGFCLPRPAKAMSLPFEKDLAVLLRCSSHDVLDQLLDQLPVPGDPFRR